MIIEKTIEDKNALDGYKIKKDDFLVMKNFTSKDNFDICMVLVNSDEEDGKIKVL